MQAKVATALGVNRNRATFRESVVRRAEIDKLAAAHLKELKVGDAVVCKHTPPGGTSTLTAMPEGAVHLQYHLYISCSSLPALSTTYISAAAACQHSIPLIFQLQQPASTQYHLYFSCSSLPALNTTCISAAAACQQSAPFQLQQPASN